MTALNYPANPYFPRHDAVVLTAKNAFFIMEPLRHVTEQQNRVMEDALLEPSKPSHITRDPLFHHWHTLTTAIDDTYCNKPNHMCRHEGGRHHPVYIDPIPPDDTKKSTVFRLASEYYNPRLRTNPGGNYR